MNVPKTVIAALYIAMRTVSILLDRSFVNAPQDTNGTRMMSV